MASKGSYISGSSNNTSILNESNLPKKLRIAWIHPNLGIGGAERLVVDSVIALQNRGHEVEVFTSFHQDGPKGRSFEETRNGTVKVHVLGGSIIPNSIGGALMIICAILRQFHLTFSFLLSTFLYNLAFLPVIGSILSIFLIPLNKPFKSSSDWSSRRQLQSFDIIIVDQLSASIPFLRWIGQNRIVFYCHFPDQLLSPSRTLAHDPRLKVPTSFSSLLRSFYRGPIDLLEATTTAEADKILVNSKFTSEVFMNTFKIMMRLPRVVYPGIDVALYGNGLVKVEEEDKWLINDSPTLLSINRFEGKKDVALAIDAFARVRVNHPNLRLVIAGGYDPLQADNVITLNNLQSLATSHSISHYTYSSSPSLASTSSSISSTPPTTLPSILFLLNISSNHKSLLLESKSTKMLLYTPSYEHFGIVPLEAMASGLPVLATDSGGPKETIVDNGFVSGTEGEEETTGLLRIPSAEIWSEGIKQLLELSPIRLNLLSQKGKERVRNLFSIEKLGEELEIACRDVGKIEKSIWNEVGFSKFCLFFILGTLVASAGLGTYYVRTF